jgi:predicted ABC-type sugar transport system permease subunit
VIVLWKRTWNFIYNGLLFFAPVLVVIALASLLVYCTYLVNFTVTAAVVSEEGGGTEAASAGLVNALMFVIPAIIGGFGIALLFKYRSLSFLQIIFFI